MVFQNPLYLWALLGLAVPVAIHLWSRKEGKTIKMGSIQFLKEKDPKQASSIKLNELLLLLLRMLVLTLLVFIIAGPVYKSEDSRTVLTYIVEPSLLQHEEVKRILDTISPDVELRLLIKDFPEFSYGKTIVNDEIPNYWLLASEMEELRSDSIVVLSAGYYAGLKGRRPQTSKNISWIQIIPDELVEEQIAAVRKNDGVEIISVTGDHTRLEIKKEIVNVNNGLSTTIDGDTLIIKTEGNERYLPIENVDTLKVSLYNDEDMQEQMRYIRSSLLAISEYLQAPIKITDLSTVNNLSVEEDLIVWLSSSPIKETGPPALIWKPDSLAVDLIEKGNAANVYYLTEALNSENVVDRHLPEQLLQLLNINKELEKEYVKYDRRVMPLQEILPVMGSMDSKINMSNTRDLSKYLWILLGILLIAERGLSAYRKQ